jgi:hypothetical protein
MRLAVSSNEMPAAGKHAAAAAAGVAQRSGGAVGRIVWARRAGIWAREQSGREADYLNDN